MLTETGSVARVYIRQAQRFEVDPEYLERGYNIALWHDQMAELGVPNPLWQMFMPGTLHASGGFDLSGPTIPTRLTRALLWGAHIAVPEAWEKWRARALSPSAWDLDTLLILRNPHFRKICAAAQHIGNGYMKFTRP